MVDNGEIALTIIEGTLVALPLWLAVIKFSAEDIEQTFQHQTFSKLDELSTAIVIGAVTGMGFFALLFAFVVASFVALGITTNIGLSLALLSVFVFLAGFQVVVGLMTQVSSATNRTLETLLLVGVLGGIAIVTWIISYL